MGRLAFSFASSPAVTRLFGMAVLSALVACGGGGDGDDNPFDNFSISSSTAQSASQNAAVIPSDSTQAMSVAMSTARAVVVGGGVSVTVACSFSGSATYSVSGPAGTIGNGRYDSGESYTIVFDECRSSSDGSVVDGNLNFTITSASGENYTATASHDVLVRLPQRTTRLNGQSSFSHTETGAGANRTTVDRWTANSISVTTLTGSRTNSFGLSNVDLTRTEVTTNGQTTRSTQGACTLSANLSSGISFNFRWASDGDVSYDVNGLPLNGVWRIVSPFDFLRLEISGGSGRVTGGGLLGFLFFPISILPDVTG